MRILLFLCLPILTFAQSEGRIETDRPDQTECPFIVKKGYFQAEMGFNRATSENLFPTSLLKIGIHKRLELRYVSVLGQEVGKETRFQTEAFGFKWAFLEPKGWIPRTSVRLFIIIWITRIGIFQRRICAVILLEMLFLLYKMISLIDSESDIM